MGSIGGGGRYDDLTGLFGVPDIPVLYFIRGRSHIRCIGRIEIISEDVHTGTQVLFFNLGETESKTAFSFMQQLRNKNIRCEIYHEQAKMDKQFKYAEKKNIPFAVIIGNRELENKTCAVKNLNSGGSRLFLWMSW